jgi:ribosomal-protein-alanine N-acetyltransferase
VIETERLSIRPLAPNERGEMLALWSDPANARVEADATPEQIRAWAEGVPWGVWESESDELIGDCSLFFADEHGEWELAYGLRRDRWGRGYATEAARACVGYGFQALGLQKIVADVDPGNPASVRVLEKCGFELAGDGADGFLVYAVTR